MEVLYILLILLVATRLFGELFQRIGQPSLIGELLAGILLGVVVTQFSGTFPVLSSLEDNEVFTAITDLGIFFLMLLAGIELQPKELADASAKSLVVAVGGMALPLAMGIGLAWWFLPQSDAWFPQALFIGTALAITAVPVTVKVLMDLGQLRSTVGRVLVSAAVYDDVISLMLLAVLTAVLKSGSLPGAAELAWLGGSVILYFAIAIFIGKLVFPRLGNLIKKAALDEFELSMLLVAALAYAVIGETLGLHFVVGAFMAGLFFGRQTVDKATYEDVKSKVSAVTMGFLAPVFFASIGLHLDASALFEIPFFLFMLLTCAFLGKFLGGGGAAYAVGLGLRDSSAVGVGMSARGAVELIIADVALKAGLFSRPEPVPIEVSFLFSAIVIMAIVTTVATPILMGSILSRGEHDTST